MGPKDFLPTYAARVARLIFLTHSCAEETHPVLKAEVQLVAMARAQLREQLLSSNRLDVPGFRESVQADLTAKVLEKLEALMDDESLFKAAPEAASYTVDSVLLEPN